MEEKYIKMRLDCHKATKMQFIFVLREGEGVGAEKKALFAGFIYAVYSLF
jgi:hypothetical protein